MVKSQHGLLAMSQSLTDSVQQCLLAPRRLYDNPYGVFDSSRLHV